MDCFIRKRIITFLGSQWDGDHSHLQPRQTACQVYMYIVEPNSSRYSRINSSRAIYSTVKPNSGKLTSHSTAEENNTQDTSEAIIWQDSAGSSSSPCSAEPNRSLDVDSWTYNPQGTAEANSSEGSEEQSTRQVQNRTARQIQQNLTACKVQHNQKPAS